MNKVIFFSGSRSDSNLLLPLIKKFNSKKHISGLVVSGSHHSKLFGNTISDFKNIKNTKKFYIKYDFNNIDKREISECSAKIILNLTNIFKIFNPDNLIVLGDRWESAIASLCAVNNDIPITHLHGGEKTYGSKDDLYRNIISRASTLHFVSHYKYKERLIKMGENPKKIFNFGSVGVENTINHKYKKKKVLEKKFNIKFNKKNILINFHPYLQFKNHDLVELKKTINFLAKDNLTNIFLTMPSLDNGSIKIFSLFKRFKKENIYFIKSFGAEYYLSILKQMNLIIGNSSSGIYEAPSLKVITINIGNRQDGRIIGKSVFNVKLKKNLIINIYKKLINKNKNNFFKKIKNEFLKKNTSLKIYKKINSFKFDKIKNKSLMY